MLDINAKLLTFAGPLHPDEMAGLISSWINALVATNVAFLRMFPDTVPLYQSGVYYREEPMGEEDFFDIPMVLHQGYADCEDLAAWRVAEYLSVGEWASILVSWEAIELQDRSVDILFHVQVQTRYGVEDPSALLGMGNTWGNRRTG